MTTSGTEFPLSRAVRDFFVEVVIAIVVVFRPVLITVITGLGYLERMWNQVQNANRPRASERERNRPTFDCFSIFFHFSDRLVANCSPIFSLTFYSSYTHTHTCIYAYTHTHTHNSRLVHVFGFDTELLVLVKMPHYSPKKIVRRIMLLQSTCDCQNSNESFFII